MPAKSTNKAGAARKPVEKKADPKPMAAAKPKAPQCEIWRCHDDWVYYHKKRYNKGDTLVISLSTLADEAEMKVIRRYFTPTKTESITMVSEPVELLAEGD